ncbi:hypothetical protein H4R34_001916 [Dimargaris verticillata]|uniref:Dymeclin n=1 Tax=Dimargaris verticillata TaxID=2761393 RepID=A0A9W8B7I8_9FUNG|nr:hypothetical protein H4R34_001916 [Dimargaris verticillata]
MGFHELCLLRDIASAHAYSLENLSFWEASVGAAHFPHVKHQTQVSECEINSADLTATLVLNNKRTANLNTLLIHLLVQMKYVHVHNYECPLPATVYNLLFILSVFLHNLLRTHSPRTIDALFNDHQLHGSKYSGFVAKLADQRDGHVDNVEGGQNAGMLRAQAANKVLHDQRSRLEQLIECLLLTLSRLNVSRHPANHPFYHLSLRFLVQLYSTQTLGDAVAPSRPDDYFLHLTLAKLHHLSDEFLQRVVVYFVAPPLPATQGNAMYNAYTYLFTSSRTAQQTEAQSLAELGLLVGLLLVHQPANLAERIPGLLSRKPSTISLQSVSSSHNTTDLPGHHSPTLSARPLPSTKESFQMALGHLSEHPTNDPSLGVSYQQMMDALFSQLDNDVTLIFLHTLLGRSPRFVNYLLARTDPEAFLVPLLKAIHQAIDQTSPPYLRLYLWLAILIQLTQDDAFNQELQRPAVETPSWLSDRASFKTMTLNQLVVLTLVRTLQQNFALHKDAFVHRCSLAALLNFSPHIHQVPALLAQRLLKVFDMVARRYLKITNLSQATATRGRAGSYSGTGLGLGITGTVGAATTVSTVTTAPAVQSLSSALHLGDFFMYMDTVKVLLLVFSNLLGHQLKHNTHFIYCLLQSKELFATLQNDTHVGEGVKDINLVIAYFQACIHEVNLKTTPSTEDVYKTIAEKHHLFRMPEIASAARLKARIDTGQQNVDFYCPFIWRLLDQVCPLPFDAQDKRLIHRFEQNTLLNVPAN